MVVQNAPVNVVNEEEIAIEAQVKMSKQTYDRLIKSKRHLKTLEK